MWTEKKFGLNLQATVTSTRKFIALSLCSLHNFLIDEACPSQLAADNFFLQVQGAVPLGEMNVPTQLLGGGHVSVEETDHRRSHVRLYGNGDESNSSLPRELLHEQVVEQDLRRPA